MLYYYLIAINILSFALMGLDKSKARRGAWGMYVFRHKTKHLRFVLGLPVILLLQLLAALFMTR